MRRIACQQDAAHAEGGAAALLDAVGREHLELVLQRAWVWKQRLILHLQPFAQLLRRQVPFLAVRDAPEPLVVEFGDHGEVLGMAGLSV